MLFWAICAILTVAAALPALLPLAREEAGGPPPSTDLQIYKSQLEEVERDVERGALMPEEARRIKIEISRRLLAADRRMSGAGKTPAPPRLASWAVVALAAALLCGGGAQLYVTLGSPGMEGKPLSERLARIRAEKAARPGQDHVEASLRGMLGAPDSGGPAEGASPERAGSVEDLRQMVRQATAAGDYRSARLAMGRIIEMKGQEAGAGDYAQMAELMVFAARGYVSPEAERMLSAALALDPLDQGSRYYSGLLLAQSGRPDLALRVWEQIAEGDPESQLSALIRAQAGEIAALAGYPAPEPPAPGPIPGVESVQAMSPERQAMMIGRMVDGLAARLAHSGGEPEEWARLLHSLGVLGETGRAAIFWSAAQRRFESSPGDLEAVRLAARRAGVSR